MSDNSAAANTTGLKIPKAIKEAHPDLIELVVNSESMNTQEQQYWIDILPIMSPEQINQLRDILTNERDQLAAIDEKYGKKNEESKPAISIQEMSAKREAKAKERHEKEKDVRDQEHEKADSILDQIE